MSVARTIYTPNHPTVQSLQQSVAAFQYNSPQITALRHEVDDLESEADKESALAAERLIRSALGRRALAPRPTTRTTPRAIAAVAPVPPAPVQDADQAGLTRPNGVVEFATTSLRMQLNQLQGSLERTDAARIEFASSKAAFKHRYSVVSPAVDPAAWWRSPATARVLLSEYAKLLLVYARTRLEKDPERSTAANLMSFGRPIRMVAEPLAR